jgi:hypothetical protein
LSNPRIFAAGASLGAISNDSLPLPGIVKVAIIVEDEINKQLNPSNTNLQ